MRLQDIDLNLLRLFDAVYRARSVSRAAELLGMTQPAASQGLRRLRLLLADPLFTRSGLGVEPTPRAERLADVVRHALGTLEQAFQEEDRFEPKRSSRTFRIHMSDIGEGRFLPELMSALRDDAPLVQVQTLPLPRAEIGEALDRGRIDLAFGFLPMVTETRTMALLRDRYIVLLRRNHPFLRRQRQPAALLDALRQLEFVAVRSHADTLRILGLLKLESRLRLITEHFMVLPSIVRATDLAAIMPRNIARGFSDDFGNDFRIVEPDFPLRDFTVSLHWGRRFEGDPGLQWLRGVIGRLFRE